MMNTYANGTCALQFPSNYVLMDTEEMTYVDGGYRFLSDEWYGTHVTSRADFALGINLACYIVAAFSGLTAASALASAIAKFGTNVVVKKIGGSVLVKYGLTAVGVGGVLNLLSGKINLGYAIACIADRCDGCYDGYITWTGWGGYGNYC